MSVNRDAEKLVKVGLYALVGYLAVRLVADCLDSQSPMKQPATEAFRKAADALRREGGPNVGPN